MFFILESCKQDLLAVLEFLSVVVFCVRNVVFNGSEVDLAFWIPRILPPNLMPSSGQKLGMICPQIGGKETLNFQGETSKPLSTSRRSSTIISAQKPGTGAGSVTLNMCTGMGGWRWWRSYRTFWWLQRRGWKFGNGWCQRKPWQGDCAWQCYEGPQGVQVQALPRPEVRHAGIQTSKVRSSFIIFWF